MAVLPQKFHRNLYREERNGIARNVRGKEHFLSYAEFSWFKDARLSEIEEVQLTHGRYLRWEELDVDLDLDSLDRYPLKYK